MNKPKYHGNAFTRHCGGLRRVLNSEAWVSEAFDPKLSSSPSPQSLEFMAIWDTGATNTCISKKVVTSLGLQQTGVAAVTGVHGTENRPTYLVNLTLPNKVRFPVLKVTELKFVGGDVLIGMDIIVNGDLAITNFDGKTAFSFHCPSAGKIDFVEEINKAKPKSIEDRNKARNKLKQARKKGKGR